MRWVFLSFVALLAVLGNTIVFEQISPIRIAGGILVNMFIAGLLLVWWAAYFLTEPLRPPSFVVAHALIMLSVAIAWLCLGYVLMQSGRCEVLMSEFYPAKVRSRIASYIQSLGYCRELGFLFAAVGLWSAYPGLRLFAQITFRGGRKQAEP